MPYVRVGDIDVYYQMAGTGPRLLYISGTGGDLRVKPNVFDGPLPKRFQVLAFDQRGLGQTSKPAPPYAMADYARDAAGLLDALQWDCVYVIGVSFGGMVAQELALRHGDRVRRLVLACTSSGGSGGASFSASQLAELPEDEQLARQLELSDTRRNAAWRVANPGRWTEFVEMARQGRRPDRDATGAQAQLAARAGHDTWDGLDQLAMPVLVAGGRYDGIAPPENLQAMAGRIPGAELRLFEGGHLFMIQDKDAYPVVTAWLEGGMKNNPSLSELLNRLSD